MAKIVNFPEHSNSTYNPKLQSLHCKYCLGTLNLSRKSIANPLRMVMLMEAFDQQHKSCKEFENYRRARNEQIYKRGMKLALVN
jgi:hypothetical protein